MSVVVDSSVLVAALVDTGPDGTWAENLVEGGALYAPELAQVEVTNILRRLEQGKKITTPEANVAYDDLMQLEIELFPFAPFADRIWELRPTVTSYDAWYVSVAEAIGFPLATLDGRLAKAPGPKCAFLTPDRR
ncbi:MAG: type II toxin-antitoxin system VapC family toxin [Steroidobacteraceae bacterium]